MVCPSVLALSLCQDRRAITVGDTNSLIRRLREYAKSSFRDSDDRRDLIINCHGRFFHRESAHVMAAYLRTVGIEDVSTDVFVFPPDSPVRIIRLLGLSGLHDGRPSAATMQAVDEADVSDVEDEESGLLSEEDAGGSEGSSDESEVDVGLSQEFAF